MRTNKTRLGLSILAGAVSFVGPARATDIVIDGSYESATNNLVSTSPPSGQAGTGGPVPDAGWTPFTTYSYSSGYTQTGPLGCGQVYLRPYGDYGTSDVRATVELASGAVGMLLHANRYVSSNYRVNNHDREDKLDGVVRWHDADASATLRFGSSRQKMRFPGARSTVQMASDPAGSATQNDHGLTDAWNVGVSATRSVGIGEFAIDIDYRNKKADNKFPALFAANATDSDTVTVSPRLRIPHQNGSLLVGIDSTRWTYSNIDLFGLANANQTIDALYAQETWTPLPGTDISAGIRTSSYKDSFSRPAVASRRDTLNAFELSLRQRLVGGFDAYGKWGQSFRVATANENYNVFTGTVTRTADGLWNRTVWAEAGVANGKRQVARGKRGKPQNRKI